MRILVLGAGAVGGYFGGRLLQAGRDVTFVVRPARAAALAASGLSIRSRFGDAFIAAPAVITADRLTEQFDLILLSCKAYDLDPAIQAIGPAVGATTLILPLLNGMLHMDRLDDRFGASRVMGGLCAIGATVDAQGVVIHLNDIHSLSFGERGRKGSPRALAILEQMSGAIFDARASDRIVEEMWEKWVFLAALAAGTCLMRASIGQIVRSPGGKDLMLGLLEECRQIAQIAGCAPRESFLHRTRSVLTETDSAQTASMLRDIERDFPIESDHVIGDLIHRAGANPSVRLPLLNLACTHLKAYEMRRASERAKAPRP